MRILVTGASGYVGSALIPRLRSDGHHVRGYGRSAARVTAPVDEMVEGDAGLGTGLDRALDGVDVAYFLIHSMEGRRRVRRHERRPASTSPPRRPRPACGGSSTSAGWCPPTAGSSRHLASRLGGRGAAAGRRAGVDRAARLDRDRRPLALVPVPRAPDRADAGAGAARVARQPHGADRRARHARVPRPRGDGAEGARRAGRGTSAGPDVMTYGELVERIANAMLVGRPRLGFNVTDDGVASVVAAAIADEDVGLITPLMESLENDLLPRHEAAPGLRRPAALVRRGRRAGAARVGAGRGADGPMSTVSEGASARLPAGERLEVDHGPDALQRVGHDPPQDLRRRRRPGARGLQGRAATGCARRAIHRASTSRRPRRPPSACGRAKGLPRLVRPRGGSPQAERQR